MVSVGRVCQYACWCHGIAGRCWFGQGLLFDRISYCMIGSCVDGCLLVFGVWCLVLVGELVCSAIILRKYDMIIYIPNQWTLIG